MCGPNLFDEQGQVFACMLANTKENRKYPYLVCASSYQISSSLKQRRSAQFEVSAADCGAWLADTDVRRNRFDRGTPLRVTRAVGEQNNAGGVRQEAHFK